MLNIFNESTEFLYRQTRANTLDFLDRGEICKSHDINTTNEYSVQFIFEERQKSRSFSKQRDAYCTFRISKISFFFLKIHTRPELVYFPNEQHTVVRTLPLAKIIGRIIISICGLNKLVLEKIKKGKRR